MVSDVKSEDHEDGQEGEGVGAGVEVHEIEGGMAVRGQGAILTLSLNDLPPHKRDEFEKAMGLVIEGHHVGVSLVCGHHPVVSADLIDENKALRTNIQDKADHILVLEGDNDHFQKENARLRVQAEDDRQLAADWEDQAKASEQELARVRSEEKLEGDQGSRAEEAGLYEHPLDFGSSFSGGKLIAESEVRAAEEERGTWGASCPALPPVGRCQLGYYRHTQMGEDRPLVVEMYLYANGLVGMGHPSSFGLAVEVLERSLNGSWWSESHLIPVP